MSKKYWFSDIFKDEDTANMWIPILMEQRKKFYKHRVRQTVSSLPLLNFDKLYEDNKQTGAELIAIGHDSEADTVEEIKKILFQSSDGDLTFVAQCKCGQMKGNYHLGDVCPNCHTKVETSFASEINIKAWVELPDCLPPFLHPKVYRVLNDWMGTSKGKSSKLDAVLSVKTDLPPDYKRAGIGQGMWYFADPENFWSVIRYEMSTHKGQKALKDKEVLEFLEKYKDCIWIRHIPILNQSLHILTHSGTMTYNDKSSEPILEACVGLNEVIKQIRHQPKANRVYIEQQVFDAYKSWSEYTNSIIKGKIISKSGFIRKNILGTRLHWTGRGVIVPITGRHYADEIELPWRMVVGMFKLEIINKLKLNYGFDVNTALKYWQQAQTGINPNMPEGPERDRVQECIDYVKACIDQLHDECPFKGFPIIMGRNPTLRQGALQLFFCRRYKTEQSDDTVGMSPFAISAPNADFDGDSLYLASIKEMCMVIDLLKIHPMTTLLGAQGEALSNMVHMSDEMSVSMHGYLTDDGKLDIESYRLAVEKIQKRHMKQTS